MIRCDTTAASVGRAMRVSRMTNSSPPNRNSSSMVPWPISSSSLKRYTWSLSRRQLDTPPGALAEDLVAGLVPEGVVDLLEAVEIQEQQGALAVGVARDLGEVLLEGDVEEVAVAELGQLVVVGEKTQPPLGPLAIRDVAHDAGEDALAEDVARVAKGDLQRQDLAVLLLRPAPR